MNPVKDCVEARADFIQMAHAPHHVEFLDSMVESSRRMGDGLFPYDWDGRQIANDMQRVMTMAEMWTATPDMMDLIVHAAKSMPPESLERLDLPSQQGFLWLPKPLHLIDIRGERLSISGILWSEREIGRPGESPGEGLPEVARGVVIWMFVEFGHPDDPVWESNLSRAEVTAMMARAPRLSLVHSMSVAFGRLAWDIDTTAMEGVDPDTRARIGRMVMRSTHDVASFEQQADGRWIVQTTGGYIVKATPDVTIQFLKAYFHFVKSELSGLDRDFPPRSMSKWLRRLGIPESPVTVVRLRRRVSGQETGNGWQLTYRYVRRGHWRMQWYGSGEDRHQRAIFILPTIVGPEDGPLRVREVVNLAQF